MKILLLSISIYYLLHLIYWIILFISKDLFSGKNMFESKKEALIYLIPFCWIYFLIKVFKKKWQEKK